MFDSQLSLRAVTSWLLIGALIGVVPVNAAQQPGTPAASATAAPPALPLPLHDVLQIAALPRTAQQAETQGTSGASPARATHHISRWVWVAIAAGIGVGVGVGVIVGNSQPGKTAATTPTATIGAGSGVTAGAP